MSTPALAIERLSYTYPDGTAALHEITLQVAHGERIALIGHNGAGKSTLLLHLNGLIPSPQVTLCGHPAVKAHLATIRQKIGLVFQNPDDQLFCSSVEEDIAFGPRNLRLPPAEIDTRVEESLDAVGMQPLRHRSAFHLSIGQKKRAAIATALAMHPEVLVLDEPTSNLDHRGRRELSQVLNTFPGTMIIATHDLEWAAPLCARMVHLAEGRIIGDGPSGAIMDQFTALL